MGLSPRQLKRRRIFSKLIYEARHLMSILSILFPFFISKTFFYNVAQQEMLIAT